MKIRYIKKDGKVYDSTIVDYTNILFTPGGVVCDIINRNDKTGYTTEEKHTFFPFSALVEIISG